MTTKTETFPFGMDVRAAEGLPAARLDFTMAFNAEGLVIVHAAYLRVKGSSKKVAKSVAFDDGRVVVDYDETKRVRGVELLAGKTLRDLPDFFALVKRMRAQKSEDGLLLLAAGVTLPHAWQSVEFAGNAALAILGELHASGLLDPAAELKAGMEHPITRALSKSMPTANWDTGLAA